MKIKRGLILLFFCTQTSLFADNTINSWTKPTSGNWDDPSAWSLSVLPGSSQSVLITNSGWKAVAINPTTPINFPDSMTVGSLSIHGAWDTENVLLLNYVGTAVPLTVLNGLTLQDMARIVNFNSGLVVQSGTINLTNAQIYQDGGFIRTTNTTMYLNNAEYDLTNGVFEGGQVVLGYPVSARFNQYAGAVAISDLRFGEGPAGAGGAYALYGGYLSLPGGLTLVGGGGAYSSYFQSGGTNQTTSVYMEPNIYGSTPSFTLNGGVLADTDVSLVADDYGYVTLNQNGGTHIITNTLSIAGASTHGEAIRPGTYNLNGGTLSAGVIDLHADQGDSVFVQSNGTTSAGTVYAHSVGYFASFNTFITLAGGTLSCSNYTTVDGRGTFTQSGGALVVSNLLDFGGSRNLGGTVYYGRYTFTGGTVTASNINITEWSIGDGSANRISNPGFFSLSHLLQISNAVEQLGRFILATNATIDLAGSASRLSFANSSGQAWAGGATLVVAGWNGNPSGGGAEQLRFGTSQSGLTPAQLSQIKFNVGSNLYPAKILATGEVVPDQGSSTSGVVNSWINPTSSDWDQASNWSLAVLPSSSQSVMITNSGWKAVAINASTPTNFPDSMTVSNLTIRGATNTENVLLLNYFGTTVPLTVLNGLTLQDDGRIVNFNSGLVVQGGTLLVTNSTMIQDGGFVRATNGPMYLQNAVYNLTNGLLSAGTEFINGTFNQQNGTNAGSVTMQGGTYNLAGGLLSPGDLQFAGGVIRQTGGTNNAGNVSMSAVTFSTAAFYDFRNGRLAETSLTLAANTGVDQFGGYHTNGGMTLLGSAATAVYTLNGGTFEAPFITMNMGSFNHYGGTNRVGTISMSNGSDYVINSGLLVVDEIQIRDVGFADNGGALAGARNLTLANAYWQEWHAAVQLGHLQLSNGANSVLYLSANPCVFHFTDSSGVPWAGDGRLTIPNWSGSLNGGGPQQLFFGTSSSGLTSQQLSQVEFSNPAGLPNGTYPARILATGEVVPAPGPTISMTRYPSGMVISWSGNYQLFSSTNVSGPYTVINGATSPYTNSFNEPQRFFRLRSP